MKKLFAFAWLVGCASASTKTDSPRDTPRALPATSASASASVAPTRASTLHTDDAKRTLAAIARSEVTAWERETTAGATHQMCPSAHAIPASLDALAPSYASTLAEWHADAGWSCLRFEIRAPQSFQLEVVADGKSFHAFARARDTSGPVELELAGAVSGDKLVILPDVIERGAH